MVHPPALPPRRPGPHPAVVAGCIVLGIAFAILGPGACALSCVTAPDAIDEALQVCGDGMTEKCRELAGSDTRAEMLRKTVTLARADCGVQPTFDATSTHVNISAPWDMRAEVGGRIVAGDCTTTPAIIRLHGHPLAWSIVEIEPQ